MREPLATPFVLGMLHLAGDNPQAVIDQAVQEAAIYRDAGVDGCIVENYFGTPEDVEAVLAEFSRNDPGLPIGVNLLDDDARGFRLATTFGAAYLQLDSVAGHLGPEQDSSFAANLAAWRSTYSGTVLGGVRFKYQPVLSGNDLATDLLLGAERCDAIVVSGDRTGGETPLDKLTQFRALLGDRVPLVVGSGMTPANADTLFAVASGAIVGSWFKDSGVDTGVVDAHRARELMQVVRP